MARTISRQLTNTTSFYEVLQVAKDCTEQDLKRAYRKQALVLHPDKQGGDGEPFKKMKYAYDVLLDPKKRTAYDKYGEAGVKAVDGQMTPDVAMEIFLNIGMRERLTLVMIVTLITGFILLFPILLCVRWDHPDAISFVAVFTPVWLILGGTCLICCCCVRAPTIGEEDDEDTRASVEEIQAQTRKLRWSSYFFISIFGILFGLLTFRLDGTIKWSYFAVIWPWMLLEVSSMLWSLHSSEQLFLIMGGNPEVLVGRRWFQLEWLTFVLDLIRTNIVHLVFATLLALKLDTMNISWWLVFVPIWLDYAVSMVSGFSRCGSVKSPAEYEQMTDEQKANEVTRSGIVCTFIFQSIRLGCVVLFVNKLVVQNSYSAYIVFLPVFLTAGCFCCCLSCAVCTISPPQGEEDEETGVGAAAASAEGANAAPGQYGSMGEQVPPAMPMAMPDAVPA